MLFSAGLTPGLSWNGSLRARLALARFFSDLCLLPAELPLVFLPLWRLVSGLLVLLALFGCPFGSGLLGGFFACGFVLCDSRLTAFTLRLLFLLRGPFAWQREGVVENNSFRIFCGATVLTIPNRATSGGLSPRVRGNLRR